MKRSRSDPEIEIENVGTNEEQQHESSNNAMQCTSHHENPMYNLPKPKHGSPRLRSNVLARRPLKENPEWIESGEVVAPVYESIAAYTSGAPPIIPTCKFELSEVPDRSANPLRPLPLAPKRIKTSANNDVTEITPDEQPFLKKIAGSMASLFFGEISPPSMYKVTDV